MRIFIDDERFPPNDGNDWIVVRNKKDFFRVVASQRFPDFISFDHDLGEDEPTGFDIVKEFIEMDLDNDIIPKNFAWYTHSQNPIGKQNIDGMLNNYLDMKFRSVTG